MKSKKKQTLRFETNKERVIHELNQMGYDLGVAAEEAVAMFAHLPTDTLSFDETETISYYNKGEVVISLTGQDITEFEAIEDNMSLVVQMLRQDVHKCLLEVLNEYS